MYEVLPSLVDLTVYDTEPEAIIDRRLVNKGNAAHLQVLLKWSTLPSSFATWEDYEVTKKRFPQAPAWGQVVSKVGGNGTATLAAMRVCATEKNKG